MLMACSLVSVLNDSRRASEAEVSNVSAAALAARTRAPGLRNSKKPSGKNTPRVRTVREMRPSRPM